MSTELVARVLLAGILMAVSALIPATPVVAQSCQYWVAPAPAGNDSNPGTLAQPWATLQHAAAHVPDNTCTVWLKDGTYTGQQEMEARFTTPTTFKAIHPYKAILQHSGIALDISGARNILVEGLEFRHTGPGASPLLVQVRRKGDAGVWAELITLRNNIFHDSYNNDLLKIYTGARFITVENNVFYNQEGSDQHIDVNSVTDVVIQDNIFFNDFAGSGRSYPTDTKAFIVIKDSNESADGLLGSERVTVRRNIFLNWEGGAGETLLQIGNDGKPYHEAKDVRVENNLVIGNARNDAHSTMGVRGARNVTFANNTIVGDLPGSSYAFWISVAGSNPSNQNIAFYNNIWSDPTGTMGANLDGGNGEFSDGDPADTLNLILDNNIYWNGGAAIPPGELVSPLVHDARRVVANPLLNTNQASVVLPRWNGSAFLSGSTSIREEFVRLVEQYGKILPGSPANGKADRAFAPADDILGRPRTATPDLGAYEYNLSLSGHSSLTALWLNWSDPDEPNATSLAITYTVGTTSILVPGIPISTRAYTLTGLLPYSLYTVTLTARGGDNAILARSNALVLLTTDLHVHLPILLKSAR
jgi:hypothetical protein